MHPAAPWILWHLLPFDYYRDGGLRRAEAVDVVADWLSHDHDDDRLAASVDLLLRGQMGQQVTTADGTSVQVALRDGQLAVQWPGQVATVSDMAAAARILMTADDPPRAPSLDRMPACQPAPAVPASAPAFVSTRLAQVRSQAPAPVKTAAPDRRPKAGPSSQQLSLF